MRKIATTALTIGLLGAALTSATPASAGTATVDICHATGNGKYVAQSPAKSADVAGHAGHQDAADIIPAFSYVDKGVRHYFRGQNLDKVQLLATGCKVPAAPVTAGPIAPVYVPASCSRPTLPYGEVVVPTVKGDGVASSTEPSLNAESTVYSVAYTLAADTEDIVYSWPAGVDGSYVFDVIPITADPYWVIDSETGVGQCELPDTGAEALPIALAGTLLLGGIAFVVANQVIRRKKKAIA